LFPLERRHSIDVSLATLSIVAASLCVASVALAQNRVGAITQLTGTATVQGGGKVKHVRGRTQVQPVVTVPGAAIPVGLQLHDRVITDADSALVITLIDNSTLSVMQPTTLMFDRTSTTPIRSQIKLLAGSLEASVRPPSDLDFLTDNGHIRIVGTVFDITYIEGVVRPGYGGCRQYTDVVVYEGVVAVNNPANPTVVVQVPAGYETTIPCLLPPLNPGPMGITGARAATSAGGRTTVAASVTGSAAPPPGIGLTFPGKVVDP